MYPLLWNAFALVGLALPADGLPQAPPMPPPAPEVVRNANDGLPQAGPLLPPAADAARNPADAQPQAGPLLPPVPEVRKPAAGLPPARPLLPRAANVVRNAANGTGNTIIIDNGGRGGRTVISNSRNGVGNRVVVVDGEVVEDVPGLPAAPLPGVGGLGKPALNALPAAPVYRGKDTRFWTMKFYNPAMRCTVYWCPKALTWYRYEDATDSYRPVNWAAEAVAPDPDDLDD